MIKLILLTIVLLAGAVLASSCQTAKLVFFEHPPSKSFLSDKEINRPELQPFIDHGVLFVVGLKAIDHRKKYNIGLALFSENPGQEVIIERADIQGESQELVNQIDTRAVVEEQLDQTGLYTNSGPSIRLFPLVDAKDFNRLLGSKKHLTLTVFYRLSGKQGAIDFKLNRRVEKQMVFST